MIYDNHWSYLCNILNNKYRDVARITVNVWIFVRRTEQSELTEWRLGSKEARRQHRQRLNVPDRLHTDDKILIGVIEWVAVKFWVVGIDLKTIFTLCWSTVTQHILYHSRSMNYHKHFNIYRPVKTKHQENTTKLAHDVWQIYDNVTKTCNYHM